MDTQNPKDSNSEETLFKLPSWLTKEDQAPKKAYLTADNGEAIHPDDPRIIQRPLTNGEKIKQTLTDPTIVLIIIPFAFAAVVVVINGTMK